MDRYSIPGGYVIIGTDKNILHKQAFGFACTESNSVVTDSSLFRMASLTKPITATAIMILYEKGKLKLDEKVFDILRDILPLDPRRYDPRLKLITIQHLLEHTGGWDNNNHPDPMFDTEAPAKFFNIPAPASGIDIIRYVITQPLHFDPGTRFCYSNLGYAILGRIIEIKSQMSYESFVRKEILHPLGLNHMQLGKTLPINKHINEVCYYDYFNAPLVQSVYSLAQDKVPAPDGGFYLEAMDSHGGWIATASDILDFVLNFKTLLNDSTVTIMLERPNELNSTGNFYGLGWNVQEDTDGKVIWHTGSLPGTCATMVNYKGHYSFVVIFNSRDRDFNFLQQVGDLIVEYTREN